MYFHTSLKRHPKSLSFSKSLIIATIVHLGVIGGTFGCRKFVTKPEAAAAAKAPEIQQRTFDAKPVVNSVPVMATKDVKLQPQHKPLPVKKEIPKKPNKK